MSPAVSGDAWQLLGARTWVAWVLTGCYLLATVALPLASFDTYTRCWPVVGAVLLFVLAGVVLVATPGDPMPLWATVVLVVACPAACALQFSAFSLPLQTPHQLWPVGASIVPYTFLCVRRRIVAGWIGGVSLTLVCLGWTTLTGQSAGKAISISVLNAGPLMMSTLFAVTVVPAADTIYRLRAENTRRAAADAAAGAALAVRDARLRRLDRLVRPALDRIAAGPPFLDSEVAEFLVLEAHLRDTLRAPGLVGAELDAAVRAARERGVRVRLHDDGGLTGTDPLVRERIHRRIVEELGGVTDGVVTVRILPPGRRRAVTMVSSATEAVRRLDLGRDGVALQPADSAPSS
ncbi:hypothetical protein [Nocardia harenae]|uniref:hypothetical protein n=1 Tax=Nocardia harenae TaxID=358707 RepID=UPI00082AC75F|nr:hypothetical protein [Nocardia harenae]